MNARPQAWLLQALMRLQAIAAGSHWYPIHRVRDAHGWGLVS